MSTSLHCFSPAVYKAEYDELEAIYLKNDELSAKDTNRLLSVHIKLRIGCEGTCLGLVQRMYLAWRTLVVNYLAFEVEREDDDVLEGECFDMWMVGHCCTVFTKASGDILDDPRVCMSRLGSLCELGVLAHILLFQNTSDVDGVPLVKWMLATASKPAQLPRFEFRLHTLYLVHCVDEMEMGSDVADMCSNRDMSALQMFAHDLLRWMELKKLFEPFRRATDRQADAMAKNVYGKDKSIAFLDYEQMLHIPVYSETESKTTRVSAPSMRPSQLYDLVCAYGFPVGAPGAPCRKRTRV